MSSSSGDRLLYNRLGLEENHLGLEGNRLGLEGSRFGVDGDDSDVAAQLIRSMI